MLVSELIRMSLRKIGAISTGETVSVVRNGEALYALISMLRSWSQKRILVYTTTQENLLLTPNQTSYTWGIGANINTVRPNTVISAFVRDSNGVDSPIEIISEGTYKGIPVKTVSSRPKYLYYNPAYPYGIIYLYPSPATVETLLLTSLKPFTETSSFSGIYDTFSFPPNYEEAIIYNLAIRLAPEYSISVSDEVASIASSSYFELTVLNASLAVEPATVLLPAGNRQRVYNINLG